MAQRYPETLASAQAQGWGCRCFLLDLCEAEAADRKERRRERLLKESGPPTGKTLGTLDEEQLPAKIRRQWPALLDGVFVERVENVLAFGLPTRGKTHLLVVLGRELILRHGHTVCFTSTFKLVQQLLAAKAALKLTALLQRLDRFQVVVLNDLGYVQQSREEREVFFTVLAGRYERSSVMISSNRVFSQWDQIFKARLTPMAAVDRLVNHAHILEFDNQSIRATQAKKRSRDWTHRRPPPWVVPLRNVRPRLTFLRSTPKVPAPGTLGGNLDRRQREG